MDEQTKEAIGNRWSHRSERLPRIRWWESPTIMAHVARKINPEAKDGSYWARQALLKTGRTFENALSIGFGNAHKEIPLLKSGLVKHFDLFELAPRMIEEAREASRRAGVVERCSFHYGDFFESPANRSGSYDLVFWSGSLHHMLNARFAVLASYDLLKDDGYFYCDEYVGKNRFQYSILEIMVANGVRSILPPAVFSIPGTSQKWDVLTGRPPLQAFIEMDPSEAADSENIVPSIRKVFPHAEIIPLGGVVYNFALMDILTNIPEGCGLLHDLLKIDDEANDHGLYQYAFCLTPKKAPV